MGSAVNIEEKIVGTKGEYALTRIIKNGHCENGWQEELGEKIVWHEGGNIGLMAQCCSIVENILSGNGRDNVDKHQRWAEPIYTFANPLGIETGSRIYSGWWMVGLEILRRYLENFGSDISTARLADEIRKRQRSWVFLAAAGSIFGKGQFSIETSEASDAGAYGGVLKIRSGRWRCARFWPRIHSSLVGTRCHSLGYEGHLWSPIYLSVLAELVPCDFLEPDEWHSDIMAFLNKKLPSRYVFGIDSIEKNSIHKIIEGNNNELALAAREYSNFIEEVISRPSVQGVPVSYTILRGNAWMIPTWVTTIASDVPATSTCGVAAMTCMEGGECDIVLHDTGIRMLAHNASGAVYKDETNRSAVVVRHSRSDATNPIIMEIPDQSFRQYRFYTAAPPPPAEPIANERPQKRRSKSNKWYRKLADVARRILGRNRK